MHQVKFVLKRKLNCGEKEEEEEEDIRDNCHAANSIRVTYGLCGGWIFFLYMQTDAAIRFALAMREASILTLQGVKLDKNFQFEKNPTQTQTQRQEMR